MGRMTDHILTTGFDIYQRLFDPASGRTADQGVADQRWKNPDNWSYGSLGALFFAVELYRQTRDRTVWTGLMGRLEEIERYVGAAGSVNYSLYFGKTGLAHLYTRLFEVSGRKEFSARALALVQDCFDPGWWPPAFEKSSMAEGISGFLLFSLSFYQATGEAAMTGVVQRLLSVLSDQAELGNDGVFWRGNGPDGRHWSGMAYGGSGIALALLQGGMASGDHQLLDIGKLAMNFESSCDAGEKSTFPLLGLYHGEAGRQLIRLYYERSTGVTEERHSWEKMVRTMSRLLNDTGVVERDMGMSNGLAGWGISLLEGALITGRQEDREMTDQIGRMLLRHPDAVKTRRRQDGCFSTGLAGIGYFLLRWNCPDMAGHLPFPTGTVPYEATLPVSDHKKGWSVSCYGDRLQTCMPGTFRLLRELHPGEAERLLSGAPMLPQDLIVKVRGLVACAPGGGHEKELLTTAEREYFKTTMQKWAIVRVYAGDEELKRGVTRLFGIAEKNFMHLRVKVSSHIKILDLDERQGFLPDGRLNPEDLDYLLTGYGAHTFRYIVDRYGSVDSQMLGIDKLYCFLFAEEKTVREALCQLISLVDRQEKKTSRLLAGALGGNAASDLNKRLENMMISAIRTLVVTGVLRVI